jgi:hypothetical protein
MKLRTILGVLLLLSLSTVVVWGQESRATLAGTVTDPQGALVPGANVEAKNMQTNVVSTTVTSGAGVYSISALNPGQYEITVSAAGFKSSVQSNVELRVGARRQLDFKLEVGAVSETVEVTGEAPLLETGTASQGTVIAQAQISNLPVLNNNVMTLMKFTAGAVATGGLTTDTSTPWSSGALSNYNVNGSDGFNAEYMLDGAPNSNQEQLNWRGPNMISVVPPSDAVGEFKVQTNTYDAEYGRSGGGLVNVSLKSGTNEFHGSLYEIVRNDIFNANSSTNKSRLPTPLDRPPVRWNQPGGSVTGPVIKDKLFFMFSYEAIRQRIPSPVNMVVPTLLEREGDFSKTLAPNGQPIKIYDPTTTVQDASGNYVRTEFTGSKVPTNRMDPVALNIRGYIPQPNMANIPRGQPNLILSPNSVANTYNTYTTRVDYQMSSQNSLYATFNHDDYIQNGGTQGYEDPAASSRSETLRGNNAVNLNFTAVPTANFVSVSRVSFARHTTETTPYALGFDPASLGFPSSLVAQLPALSFPTITLGGGGAGGPPGGSPRTIDNTWSFGQTFSKVASKHALKFGGEFRVTLNNPIRVRSTSGSYSFSSGFTQANPLQQGDPFSGDATASFLLGYASGGSVPTGLAVSYANRYYALFLQDDWRVSNNLTLNMGFRWDVETPKTERFNRVVVGFDTTTEYPLSTDVMLKGGLVYGSKYKRTAYDSDLNNFQPRIGFSFKVTDKLVIRGGYGISFTPTVEIPASTGYTATTSMVPMNPNFTPANVLSNPYPNGINVPTGDSLGLSTNLGQSVTYLYSDHATPKVQSISIGFQYELPFRTVANVSYASSRSSQISVPKQQNGIPGAQWQAMGMSLADQVPNPYAGLLPGTPLNGPKITREQSLRPYPQFSGDGGVGEEARSVGMSFYDALQIQFEKRLSKGLMVLFNYTWGKSLGQREYYNEAHDRPEDLTRSIIPPDRKYVFNLAASYNLPFAANTTGVTRALLYGWNASTTITWQSGQPIGPIVGTDWTGVDPTLENPTMQRYFNTCTLNQANGQRQNCASASEPVAWLLLAPYKLKSTPVFYDVLRSPATPLKAGVNAAFFKQFLLTERYRIEFRADMFNLLNSAAFTSLTGGPPFVPTFGQIANTQTNEPRVGQISLKLTF